MKIECPSCGEKIGVFSVKRKFQCCNCGAALKSNIFLLVVVWLLVWGAIVTPVVMYLSKATPIGLIAEIVIGIGLLVIFVAKYLRVYMEHK